jgi:chromosome segregation ATPase
MIQEGLCETIAPITGEAGADKRRERLERAKDREIAVLQAELLSAKQELQKIDHELAQAQNEANQAARDEESYLRGLGGIFRDHEASCGDASELFPIIIE